MSFPREKWFGNWSWQLACLALLLGASARFALGALWRGDPASAMEYLYYQAGTLAFNYFEFGAVRRGLGGSIVHLLSGDVLLGTLIFHFLSAAGVAAAALWLLAGTAWPPRRRACFLLVLLTIMLRWGDDAGRTDMAVAALLALATIAATRARLVAATLCIGVGLLIHESSLIFGLPLLAALILQRGGWAALAPRERRGIAIALPTTAAIYLAIGWLPHAGLGTMVDAVRAKFPGHQAVAGLPRHEHVEWAMYYALSGLRGVRTSLCQNLTDPSNWVHPTSGLIVIALVGFALVRGAAGWRAALLAALPGFVALCIVANDTSRWAMFASFNVWLVAVTAAPGARSAPRRDETSGAAPRRDTAAILVAVLLMPIVLARMQSIPFRIYAPSPLLEAVVRRLGGERTPSVEQALARCDPQWQRLLNDAPRP